MTTKNFKTLFTYKTVYDADCLEWCPIPPFQNYFVCGTYQVVDGISVISEKRKGTILLFHVTKDKLEKKSCVEISAVLDMKWCPNIVGGNIILGVACSGGDINVFCLSNGSDLKFVTKCCLNKNKDDHLILSLDWSQTAGGDILCASDSKGNITLLKFINDGLEILQEWNAHGLEAWAVSFDLYNPNAIFSGGDDSKLHVWDLRLSEPARIATSKVHTAGVTVLNCNPSRQYSLACGSYDETISMWDTRNWCEPIRTIPAGGGLWRLKWEPKKSRYLLAACIYGGFEIVEPYETFSIVGRYMEHESLAYGADWCRDPGGHISLSDEQFLIATCSFYDQKLSVSLWDKSKDFVDS